MLWTGTLIRTKDNDILPIRDIRNGMYIETPEGFSFVSYINMHYSRYKYEVQTNKNHIVTCSGSTFFRYNFKKIRVSSLRKGDRIESKFGEEIVEKMKKIIDRRRYYKLRTVSFDSWFYLENGLTVRIC